MSKLFLDKVFGHEHLPDLPDPTDPCLRLAEDLILVREAASCPEHHPVLVLDRVEGEDGLVRGAEAEAGVATAALGVETSAVIPRH